jgi:predicted ATPase
VIDRVHFQNFKSLANVSLDLGRFTVLVGANGCGKSSVLQGMHLLAQTGSATREPGLGRFASIYSGARSVDRLISRRGGGEIKLYMRASDGDELELMIRTATTAPEHPPELVVNVGPADPLHVLVSTSTSTSSEALATLDHRRVQRFSSVGYLRADAAKMASTSIPDSESPQMTRAGSGLASVLAWMEGAAEDQLAEITADLRRVVPGIKRIRILRQRISRARVEMVENIEVEGRPVWQPISASPLGDRFAIEFDDGSVVPADLLSEGTMIALGILTKLREPRRPRLVLIDDVDRGLHLEAQTKLVQVLRALMKLDPELQIVCTTHSPYLLDLFEPSEVRVLALDAERRTHARTLVEHPDFGKWKFGTQTSELWVALGEGWVTAGATG